jgi:hypothetical protein
MLGYRRCTLSIMPVPASAAGGVEDHQPLFSVRGFLLEISCDGDQEDREDIPYTD